MYREDLQLPNPVAFGIIALVCVPIVLYAGNCALYFQAINSGEIRELAKKSAHRWMKETGVKGSVECSSSFVETFGVVHCTINDENKKLTFIECDASLWTKPEAQSCSLSRYEIRQ